MAIPPQKITMTLLFKRQLTHDVWELDFSVPSDFSCQPGQFVMFTLAPAPNRAYSVAWAQPGLLRFVIKRLENGAGGSKAACDLAVGSSLGAMGPLGHFVVPETPAARMFIGTGTGYAPLYFQMRFILEKDPSAKVGFVFGVREARDIFATEELETWKKKHPHFSYELFLSRDQQPGCRRGYVTETLTPQGIAGFEEFFICGSSTMVTDACVKLQEAGVSNKKVFFEQY